MAAPINDGGNKDGAGLADQEEWGDLPVVVLASDSADDVDIEEIPTIFETSGPVAAVQPVPAVQGDPRQLNPAQLAAVIRLTGSPTGTFRLQAVQPVPTVPPHDPWDDLSPAELVAAIRAVPCRGRPTQGEGRPLRPTGPIVTQQGIMVREPSTGQYVPWQRQSE
jgi:hypothetical protein